MKIALHRPFRLAAGLGLISALALMGACATAPVMSLSEGGRSGAPAPVEGYDWFMHADAGEAVLAYGVADSDEVKLYLACRAGSGRLDLTAHGHDNAREIYLESGGDTERFPAASEPSAIHDGTLLTVSTTTDQPVFLRFRRLGWIAAWHGDAREVYVAHPGSEKGVEDFFSACG